MWHVCGGEEMNKGSWRVQLKESNNWEIAEVDGGKILQWIVKKSVGRVWNGLIWPRIGTSCGLWETRLWTFVFRIMCVISWLAEELLASQEGLCSMALVT
jgi:hypothetical protein